MGMVQRATKPLSTLLFDDVTGRQLIRVSLWADPEDVEILDGQQDTDSPTLAVKVTRGRTTIHGKIDREAWKVYQTKDLPELRPIIPEPTEAPIATMRERMYR